jgi:hypothetical protein
MPYIKNPNPDLPAIGRLEVGTLAESAAIPAGGAVVRILERGRQENVIEELVSDSSGRTPIINLPAPPVDFSMQPDSDAMPYSEYDVSVSLEGFAPAYIEGVQILPDTTSYQDVALRPAGAEERARVHTAIRIMDTYVMAPVGRTFAHLDPARRDAAVVEQEVARWREGLAALAHYMATPLPTAEAGLTLADCVLPPSLHLSALIARMLGVGDDLLAPHPALSDYYARVRKHPVVGETLEALTAAQGGR